MAIQHRRCKSIHNEAKYLKEAGYHPPVERDYCTYSGAKQYIEDWFEAIPDLMNEYTEDEHELTAKGSIKISNATFIQDYLLDNTDKVTLKVTINPVSNYKDPDVIKYIQDRYKDDDEDLLGYKYGDILYDTYNIDYILNGESVAEDVGGTIRLMEYVEFDDGLLALVS